MAEQTSCDAKCQYADPEKAADCNCECEGKNHGQGSDTRIWEAKAARLSKTRKAFRRHLNEQEPKSGTRLYRHNRAEFDKQYAEWSGKPIEEVIAETEEPLVDEEKFELLKSYDDGQDPRYWVHVRNKATGKTEYRTGTSKDDLVVITKDSVPAEAGW